jgi:hypothetical protein
MKIADEILEHLIKEYTVTQLDEYIADLELRVTETRSWIDKLKVIRKEKLRKLKKKVVDTGARDGR